MTIPSFEQLKYGLKFIVRLTIIVLLICKTSFPQRQRSDRDEYRKSNRRDTRIDNENEVMVSTALGKVVGLRNGSVDWFMGIPYAEPPINSLRFRPSKPKKPWYPQILEAFRFSPECLQSQSLSTSDGNDEKNQNEDCLYLNVWRPTGTTFEARLPVLFWIYGGAFLHGASSRPEYIGDRLAARDVIVVSINYRLGALGFLVSIPDGLYGNYGLHDQKVAMQWVQDHIQDFGGDPDRVTLFGESAGAMSIGLHLLDQHKVVEKHRQTRLSFNTRPPPPSMLFQAVILQSNPLGYK